jgi:hypothetical protein
MIKVNVSFVINGFGDLPWLSQLKSWVSVTENSPSSALVGLSLGFQINSMKKLHDKKAPEQNWLGYFLWTLLKILDWAFMRTDHIWSTYVSS